MYIIGIYDIFLYVFYIFLFSMETSSLNIGMMLGGIGLFLLGMTLMTE